MSIKTIDKKLTRRNSMSFNKITDYLKDINANNLKILTYELTESKQGFLGLYNRNMYGFTHALTYTGTSPNMNEMFTIHHTFNDFIMLNREMDYDLIKNKERLLTLKHLRQLVSQVKELKRYEIEASVNAEGFVDDFVGPLGVSSYEIVTKSERVPKYNLNSESLEKLLNKIESFS